MNRLLSRTVEDSNFTR